MKKEIFCFNDYGYVEICLKEIMDKKHISRNALARSINARSEVVNKW